MKFKKIVALASALAVLCSMGSYAAAYKEEEIISGYEVQTSLGTEGYTQSACSDNTASVLRPTSFLRPVSDGFMRVFADTDNKTVSIEYYSDDLSFISGITLPFELDIWGGFYEGSDAYYLIEGQTNENEEDSAEVIRVIKYDKSWNRLGAASITGETDDYNLWASQVRTPFEYGCVETAESEDKLYIVTGHEGYVDSEFGMGHQGFLMIEVDKASMTGEVIQCDSFHSFAQYAAYDDGKVYVLEQSEGSRYAKISKLDTADNNYTAIPIYRYGGSRTSGWAIACRATVDDLALTPQNILTAGSSIDQTIFDNYDNTIDPYNIYITVTPKNDFSEEATVTKQITNNTDAKKRYSHIFLTKINDDRFMLSWSYSQGKEERTGEIDDLLSHETFHYIFIDGEGNKLSEEFEAEATGSDCRPVLKGSRIVFHTSLFGAVNFYSIDPQTGSFGKRTYRIAGKNAAWDYDTANKTLFISGTGGLYSDPDEGWSGCMFGQIGKEAEKIVLGKGITSVGEYTFAYFSALKEVMMSEGVTRIEKNAFVYDSALSKVYLPSSVNDIGTDAFWSGYYTMDYKTRLVYATFYAPEGSYAADYTKQNSYRYKAKDLSKAEGFAERLYTTMLGRSFDQKGLADWVSKLDGGSSAASVSSGFVLSEELVQQRLTNAEFVTRMYRTFMNREPDADGFADWVNALDGGCSYAYLLNSFVLSEEFGNICSEAGIETGSYELTESRDMSRSLTAFTSRMYTKALGRAYEVGGLNYWTGRYINGEITLDDMAYGFIFSEEFADRDLSDEEYVDVLYATFFDRPADSEGKTDWLGKLSRGEYTREQVLDGFLGAQEFANLVNSFGL